MKFRSVVVALLSVAGLLSSLGTPATAHQPAEGGVERLGNTDRCVNYFHTVDHSNWYNEDGARVYDTWWKITLYMHPYQNGDCKPATRTADAANSGLRIYILWTQDWEETARPKVCKDLPGPGMYEPWHPPLLQENNTMQYGFMGPPCMPSPDGDGTGGGEWADFQSTGMYEVVYDGSIYHNHSDYTYHRFYAFELPDVVPWWME